MVFKLSESEDLSDHSPVVSNLNVLKQRAVLGSGSCEQ
jgi:hypothetical protein